MLLTGGGGNDTRKMDRQEGSVTQIQTNVREIHNVREVDWDMEIPRDRSSFKRALGIRELFLMFGKG